MFALVACMAVAGCASPDLREAMIPPGNRFVTVAPNKPGDPKYSFAWPERATFRPADKMVRGLPLDKFNDAWSLATEHRHEFLPLDELRAEGHSRSDYTFNLSGRFGSPWNLLLVTGVYQTCGGEIGGFFAALEPQGQTFTVRQVMQFAETPFVVLHEADPVGLSVWFCLNCDDGYLLRWEPGRGAFEATYSLEEAD
jgi:hypothetical protein